MITEIIIRKVIPLISKEIDSRVCDELMALNFISIIKVVVCDGNAIMVVEVSRIVMTKKAREVYDIIIKDYSYQLRAPSFHSCTNPIRSKVRNM